MQLYRNSRPEKTPFKTKDSLQKKVWATNLCHKGRKQIDLSCFLVQIGHIRSRKPSIINKILQAFSTCLLPFSELHSVENKTSLFFELPFENVFKFFITYTINFQRVVNALCFSTNRIQKNCHLSLFLYVGQVYNVDVIF